MKHALFSRIARPMNFKISSTQTHPIQPTPHPIPIVSGTVVTAILKIREVDSDTVWASGTGSCFRGKEPWGYQRVEKNNLKRLPP